MSLYTWKISTFSIPISHVKKGLKKSRFFRCAETKLLFRFQVKFVCSRGVGSIFRLRGHQKCKPQIESRSRNLITKWKYKLEDILKLTPLAKTNNVLWAYILQKPHKVLSVKAWLLQYEKRLNNMDRMRISSTEPSSRRVDRVLLMWKHFQAGGFGAALRPSMGPGQSPGWGPGGEAPGS